MPLIKKVLKKYNVETRLIAGGSFLKHPYSKFFNIRKIGKLSNSDYIHDYGFVIGNHPKDMKIKLIKISLIINEVFKI